MSPFLTVSSIKFWSHNFSSMTCCFPSSSKHATQAGPSAPYSFDGVYLTYLQVLTATHCLFIISFVTPRQVTKIFFYLLLRLKKPIIIIIIIIIIAERIKLTVFCIGVFTLFNKYLRMPCFTLFVDRIDL